MSSVNEINSAFNQRLTPIVTLAASARPVNPFATRGIQNSDTSREELTVRPSTKLPETLGAEFQGHVIDTKNDESVQLDTYTIGENPNSSKHKHTTNRIKVEHTRER